MDNPRPFGLVHGQIFLGVGDSNDAGRAPDLLGLNGTATFTGTIERDLVLTPAAEMIIVPAPVPAPVVNGMVQWGAVNDVPLVANLDAFGNRLGWQWQVDFDLRDANNNKVKLTGWRLDVKIWDPNAAFVNGENPTVTQLVAQAPVVGPNVAQIATGPKGDAGLFWRGTWAVGTAYVVGDIVGLSGSSYVAVAPSTGSQPPSANWAVLAQKGDPGSGTGGGGYSPPTGGIPKSDLSAAVQGSLDKADGAATTAALALTDTKATDAGTAAGNAQTAADNAGAAAADAEADALAAIAALTNYALLASPAFTGNPTVPTAPAGDNDLSIANTSWVRTLVSTVVSLVSNMGHVGYNASTDTWPGRPSTSGPVAWWSTNDPAAVRPPGMLVGDSWIQHPDAVIS